MARQHAQIPPLVVDISSGSEPDEPPSQLRLEKERDSLLKDFSAFNTAFSNSLREVIVKRHYGCYNSVHVLFVVFLVWKNKNPVLGKLAQVEEVFKDRLKCTTERYEFTTRKNEVELLNLRLEEAARTHAGDDEFLIIYYAGHGHLDMHETTASSQSNRKPRTLGGDIPLPWNWSTVENGLEQSIADNSNTLHIFDSCYTPSEEVLAASQAVGRYLFTTDQTNELQVQISVPVDISVLALYTSQAKRSTNFLKNFLRPSHRTLSDKGSPSRSSLASKTEDQPCIPTLLSDSKVVTLCLIKIQSSEEEMWNEVWTLGVLMQEATVAKADTIAYTVKYLEVRQWERINGADLIIALMPSEVFRILVKQPNSRAYVELTTVRSGPDLEQEIAEVEIKKAIEARQRVTSALFVTDSTGKPDDTSEGSLND